MNKNIREFTSIKSLIFLELIQKYAKHIVAFQAIFFIFIYNSVLPDGMYFSPDSVLYLSDSKIVPPSFSLFARSLIELELFFNSTRIVFLRYIVIAFYSLGGWLIAISLIRSRKAMLAIFVLPAIWSMSFLTMFFNYYLTDGITAAFLISCIGAYANLHVSIQYENSKADYSSWWLGLFVFFGMMAFTMRPAFSFMVPVIIMMMLNRAVYSRKRLVAVVVGVVILAAAHFSFANYWHGGKQPSRLGSLLHLVIFDFPISNPCLDTDKTNLCKVQRVLKPYIDELQKFETTRDKYEFKARNNVKISTDVRNSLIGEKHTGDVLTELVILKIKHNPISYLSTVLMHSYYSVQIWGDWAWNDNLGINTNGNIINTNNIAKSVHDTMEKEFQIDFDPTIEQAPSPKFYTDLILQFPRLIIDRQILKKYTFGIIIIIIIFIMMPIFRVYSVTSSILFACCLIGAAGTVFQNAVFPIIPRLLAPFHPLGALVVIIMVSTMIHYIKVIIELRLLPKDDKLKPNS